jgi:hypothetical protein
MISCHREEREVAMLAVRGKRSPGRLLGKDDLIAEKR